MMQANLFSENPLPSRAVAPTDESRVKGFVYLIHNFDMSRFYIGSTNNAKTRFKHHKSNLRGKKHHCTALQRAWDKYRESAFTFTVILHQDTREMASLKEHELLSIYYKKRGCLNISSNGLMSAQCPLVIKKRNEILKSNDHRERASLKQKEWRAANPEKAKASDIELAQSCRSPEWRKANSERTKIRTSTPEAKLAFQERMVDVREKRKRPVIMTDANGVETRFPSITEASQSTNIHFNSIYNCCAGTRKTGGKCMWRYENNARQFI